MSTPDSPIVMSVILELRHFQVLVMQEGTDRWFATVSERGTGYGTRALPKTIRQLREERGWTQLDLALQLGVDVSTVSRWERGLAVPRRRRQQRLADLFGMGVSEIAFGPVDEQS